MTRSAHRAGPATQGGWIGLVVILLALVIVAWLAKDALKAYGLSGAVSSGTAAATRADRSGAATGSPAPGADAPPAATPIERARGLESTLQRQADETARRIDDAAR